MNSSKHTGFSLLEFMVAIAIAAVLVALAIPSFKEITTQSNLSTTINKFVTANSIARNEAVTRSKRVSICKSVDSLTCSTLVTEFWDDGWIIFVNEDNDSPAQVDAGETILRVSTQLDSQYTLKGATGVDAFVTYNPTGDTNSSGIIVLCNADMYHARAAIISVNGRVVSAERNSSGVPLDDSGAPLITCSPP